MKDELNRRTDTNSAGQLNAAGGLGGSTNVPSGATLGSLGGFQYDNGAIVAPGVRLQGGGNAHIAFGSPPPQANNSGSGIFIDQTGLYGLASSVQQAVIDASGQLQLGAGAIIGNANGIGIGNPTPPTDQATGTGLFLNGNGLFGLRNSVQTLQIDTVTGSIKWTNAAYIGELQGYLDYTVSTTGLILGQWAVTQIGQGTWHGTGRIPTYAIDTPLTYGQWISIDPTFGIRIMNANKNLGRWKANGDFLIGTDLSAPATTNFIVFNAAQTYNGESVQAGDLLLGDNSAAKANAKWIKATGRLSFRGGTTEQAYIDTDGSIVAANGNVSINAKGIKTNGLEYFLSMVGTAAGATRQIQVGVGQMGAGAIATPRGIIQFSDTAVNGNLLTNGSFDTGDMTGWAASIFAVTASNAISGPYCAFDNNQFGTLETNPRVAVTAGNVYVASGYMAINGTDNGTAFFQVRWYNVASGGAPIQTDTVGSRASFTGGPDWRYYTASLTAPVGATYATVYFNYAVGLGGSVNFYVDALSFVQQTLLSRLAFQPELHIYDYSPVIEVGLNVGTGVSGASVGEIKATTLTLTGSLVSPGNELAQTDSQPDANQTLLANSTAIIFDDPLIPASGTLISLPAGALLILNASEADIYAGRTNCRPGSDIYIPDMDVLNAASLYILDAGRLVVLAGAAAADTVGSLLEIA